MTVETGMSRQKVEMDDDDDWAWTGKAFQCA